jgi:hypothetical protein
VQFLSPALASNLHVGDQLLTSNGDGEVRLKRIVTIERVHMEEHSYLRAVFETGETEHLVPTQDVVYLGYWAA